MQLTSPETFALRKEKQELPCPAWWFRWRLLCPLSLLVPACASQVWWVFCVWCVVRQVELLFLFSLLRLPAAPACSWSLVSLLVCMSGKSALYGELAVPAVPCESGVSAVPGRVVVLPTVCFSMDWSVWRQLAIVDSTRLCASKTSQCRSQMTVLAIRLIVILTIA